MAHAIIDFCVQTHNTFSRSPRGAWRALVVDHSAPRYRINGTNTLKVLFVGREGIQDVGKKSRWYIADDLDKAKRAVAEWDSKMTRKRVADRKRVTE